ncbi:MAG: CRTAC1 family protein [Deltaproteobacteria bacterium]|nr:CRTAC1 family protein [Deltaproteobacteria bacterium]
MRLSFPLSLWLTAFPLLGAGCGESAPRASCVPGRTTACACVAEPGQGVQTCLPDGSGFGACTACTVGPAFREVSAEAQLRYLEAAPLDGVTPCAIPTYCDMNLYTGGAAIGDYDADGWPDVFASRLGTTPLLFRNRGDGTFADVTVEAGLDVVANWNGAAWGDLDNDGDLDLVAQTMGMDRHYLFVNRGDGTFSEQAIPRGVAQDDGAVKLGMSVAVGDYDRDGWLDLHVAEWSARTGPFALDPKKPGHTRLFRNRGTKGPGFFDDATASAGAEVSGPDENGDHPSIFSIATAFADFDGDDWPELAVTGDFVTSRFLWNDGGTFFERTFASGLGLDSFGMGSAIADLDRDGSLDWLVTSVSRAPTCSGMIDCSTGELGNHLYRYAGARMFEDVGKALGLHEGYWAWGAAMFDFDADGDRDVFQTNGIDYPIAVPGSYFATDANRFWRNDGGAFVEAADALGLHDTRRGKALVTFDYDRDGDLDVLVVNNAGEPALYRNEAPQGSWLGVRVLAPSGRDALGARVRVTRAKGEPPQMGVVGLGSHLLGHGEPLVHFGFGHGDEPLEEVEVHWHDSGNTKVLQAVPRNQVIVIAP